MVEMMTVLVTVVIGVTLLVGLLIVLRLRVVRFTRARDDLRELVVQGGAALRTVRQARRSATGSGG